MTLYHKVGTVGTPSYVSISNLTPHFSGRRLAVPAPRDGSFLGTGLVFRGRLGHGLNSS